MSEPLLISPYDPAWRDQFERLRERAAAVLGPLAVAVEHVGSTAVPGLAAKPVIDLDVVVASEADLAPAIARLQSLGYRPGGRRLDVAGLTALGWPEGEPRHHLYLVIADSERHRERSASATTCGATRTRQSGTPS